MPNNEAKISVRMPDEIAETGDRIYKEKFREEYEGQYEGQFLAIDVTSADGYLGQYAEDALAKAEEANPNGDFYLVKVGSPAAFHVGYTGERKNGLEGLLRPAI